MPSNAISLMSEACGLWARSLRRLRLPRIGRRGAVAISFAASALPIAIAVAMAVDFSRIAGARAALQRAVDNAALSGAASYIVWTPNDAFNPVAINMATSAFCDATTALPSGYTISALTGGKPCGAKNGPVVTAKIDGYVKGTPGILAGSGCTATKTVVAGARCGFVVTVNATAKTPTMFGGLLGASNTLAVTGMAVNPFIDLGNALTPHFNQDAGNANSLWVYPLLLNDNGDPDFSTNDGALPDYSTCTGNPDQTTCGTYTMLASGKYYGCTTLNQATPKCTVDNTVFGGTGTTIFGSGGIVQNPQASTAVITATTPLGVAFQSVAGGKTNVSSDAAGSYAKNADPQPNNDCKWPARSAYNTVGQVYNKDGKPLIVDSAGNWVYPTHWLYSSYLAKNESPSQRLIDMQLNTDINPDTSLAYQYQLILSVPAVVNGVDTPDKCKQQQNINQYKFGNMEKPITTYPTTGNSNCALYIVKNPPQPDALTPDPTYQGSHKCFAPTATPGKEYTALSCQKFGGNSFAFFWNDMSGGFDNDDTDYNDGTLLVKCVAADNVILIN